MKTQTLISLLIILLISTSCEVYDDLFEPNDDKKDQMKTLRAEGEIKLPVGTAINASELTILGFNESVRAGQSEKVSLSVAETDKPQVLFANNQKNEPVLLGLVNPSTKYFEISARTTALSLVLVNPVFMMTSSQQRSQVLFSAEKHPDFRMLVESIENLLKTDPENVLDFQLHPKIYERAAVISTDLLKNSQGSLKTALIEKDKPWIESGGNKKICVYNPKSIYYAGSFTPSINDQKSHLIAAKSSYVTVEFAWPPMYFTRPTENYFTINKDNNYNLLLTKGFDFSKPEEFFSLNTINGKATLCNTGKSIGLLVDLILGLDVPLNGFFDLVVDGKENYQIGLRMGNHIVDGDVFGVIYDLCDFAITNQDIILYWLRTELSPANGDNVDRYLATLFGTLKNVAVVTKIISVGSTAANKMIPFVYDLISSDKTISYTFTMKNGKLENSQLNSPPEIKSVTLSRNKVLVSSNFTLTVKSTDPENDPVSHRIHWGNGHASDWSAPAPSGTAVDFTYNYVAPGNYNILVEVKDSKESSGELSDMIPIAIYSETGNFVYNFESDMPDLLPMSPPWRIKQTEPSYLRVTGSDGYNGSKKSCRFVDFDPGIVNNKQSEGVATLVYVEKIKAQGSLKFAAKVSSVDDAFGVRVWQDENYNWSQMGFYVCFVDGFICYYHNQKFNQLMAVEAGKWYHFEVSYNTSQHQFDLYINGSLKGQKLPYYGSPTSLSLFQAVAFSDDACKSAWLDEISIPIEGLKSATVPKAVPTHALTSEPR